MSNVNYLKKAKNFELNDVPNKAFDCYRQAIDSKESLEFDDYINFSVLAFLFQDYGYSSSNEITKEQVDLAWSYMSKALGLCEEKYGETPIANFWKKYYATILLGEVISEDEALGFYNSGVKEAAFCFDSSPKKKSALELIKVTVLKPKTFKDRYIASML